MSTDLTLDEAVELEKQAKAGNQEARQKLDEAAVDLGYSSMAEMIHAIMKPIQDAMRKLINTNIPGGWELLEHYLQDKTVLAMFGHLKLSQINLRNAVEVTVRRYFEECPSRLSEKVGKYDALCILWVNRPEIPKQNVDEFLEDHAPDLVSRSFYRILEDAYLRGIITKRGRRYCLK